MTVDPAGSVPPEPKPVALDTTVVPLGERALRQILAYVTAVGDEAESPYLEVKSSLNLGGKEAVAKIAKFLLGAANRLPQQAAHHFQGHAVAVIGAQRDAAPGVPRGVEPHELEDRLRPYLGPQFPGFEFGRVAVDVDREVLFVIGLPPKDGQSIFPCHKDFQGDDRRDSLEDGAVYVRASSNTRKARAGEIQALVERARGGGKPPIDLDVKILGSIGRVDRVDEVIEALYEDEEHLFSTPRPKNPAPFTIPSWALGGSAALSDGERTRRLDLWRQSKPEHMAAGREHLLGVGLPGVGISVVSRGRFIGKPHLTVTFHGCESFDHLDADDADYDKLVEPVVPGHAYSVIASIAPRPFRPPGYPVNWKNQDQDVQVTLTPESFRPDVPWTTDQDDYVLAARDPQATSVTVTWVLTEEGNDEPTRGTTTVPIADFVDADELVTTAFLEDR